MQTMFITTPRDSRGIVNIIAYAELIYRGRKDRSVYNLLGRRHVKICHTLHVRAMRTSEATLIRLRCTRVSISTNTTYHTK